MASGFQASVGVMGRSTNPTTNSARCSAGLIARPKVSDAEVGVCVSHEEEGLKNEHGGCPNRWTAAEPGQDR
jgi:hypothetical protein